MSLTRSVLAAREVIAQNRPGLRARHENGEPGVAICASQTDVVDTAVLILYDDLIEKYRGAFAFDPRAHIALVPNGGYGRRDLAPYSDVDLMVLVTPKLKSEGELMLGEFVRNLYDITLDIGHNVRTLGDVVSESRRDMKIFTSLIESRLLAGSVTLFTQFARRFQHEAQRSSKVAIEKIESVRREERRQFGETVYLLEPNVKRSRGGLREIQFLRWVGFSRYGIAEPAGLRTLGVLSEDDFNTLTSAHDYFLSLRNEMHLFVDRANDLLTREEQVRLAKMYGFEGDEGLLPVEQFMRQFIQTASDVRYIVSNFVASARPSGRISRVLSPVFSRTIERDYRSGPVHIAATETGMKKLRGSLNEILRLADLANAHNKRIAHPTWIAIRADVPNLSREITPEISQHFLSLLSKPTRLAEILRQLNELGVLEIIIPPFKHARGLLQFNSFHKFTVDAHSIFAVQRATEFSDEKSPLGTAYNAISKKHLLHLALLLHDLGKGLPGDHSEVGAKLAGPICARLGLNSDDTEIVVALVAKHLLLSHASMRRDISDPVTILQTAIQAGSPEMLRMLYVLTAADIAAVGPGTLNSWNVELITELYNRTFQYLTGDQSHDSVDRKMDRRLEKLRGRFENCADAQWFDDQIDQLPNSYLYGNRTDKIENELRRMRQLPTGGVEAWGCFLPERKVVEFTIGASENVTDGLFHKLTGAISSKGLTILAAEINTFADGHVMDRFFVKDPDYPALPPQHRIDEICSALVNAVSSSASIPPRFRNLWKSDTESEESRLAPMPTKVAFDNSTSEKHTILDIFTHDRIGLLYTITRVLHEQEMSVHLAKIGTFLDQVVDVFFITDLCGKKIEDAERLNSMKQCLLKGIEEHKSP